MGKNKFFKTVLLGTLISSYAMSGPDNEYLSTLETSPFNQLTATGTTPTYTTPNNTPNERLFTEYKGTILFNLFDREMSQLVSQATSVAKRQILEIGTGEGVITSQLLRHMVDGGNTDYDGVNVVTVDDFRPRAAEEGIRGNIDIPARYDFVTATDTSGTNAGEEIQQMLSRFVFTEIDEGAAPDSYLSRVIIARKTAEANATAYVTWSDADFVNTPDPSYLFTAEIVGGVSSLNEVVTNFNGGDDFGIVWVDTDPTSTADMVDTLRVAWNAIDITEGGTLIVDDYSWSHRTTSENFYVRDGVLQFLNTYQVQINSLFGDVGPVDFTSNQYVAVYQYNGTDTDIPLPARTFNLVTRESAPFLAAVEFHNIWSTDRWITLIRKIPAKSSDVSLA